MQYNLKSKPYILSVNSGFTLVETLVVVFVFSIIMVLVGSIFTNSLNIQRKAFNIQQAEEGTGFILESMAKEIRVSRIVNSDTNCPSAPTGVLNITHPVNGNVSYFLSGTAIHRSANGIDTVISSNATEFTRLQFCILGTPIDDKRQPRVTVIGSVRSTKTKQQSVIDFQTTLSQRFLSN
ncbi:MAG: type II secretion system protein [Patescibacteria group bacterium]